MGFIKIHGLGQTTQAKHQLLKGKAGRRLELPSIIPPARDDDGPVRIDAWRAELMDDRGKHARRAVWPSVRGEVAESRTAATCRTQAPESAGAR